MAEEEIDVTECPECGEKGNYDGRILVDGRGIYACPQRHKWQNMGEKPSNKGVPIQVNRDL